MSSQKHSTTKNTEGTKERQSLRIESDGTCIGTRVLTEDGVEIKNVTKVTWSLDPRNYASKATIEIDMAKIDAKGDMYE